jgi:hypothetical protein
MRALRLALHPIPEVEKIDTSLRYTDILFGFVIRELFLRLKNFPELDASVQWHLIVGTTLVLGSWVGFRRSLNRSSYTVKFFNLPLFKFFLDQAMLVLYFRLAVMTDVDPNIAVGDPMLAVRTTELIAYVFILYLGWDVLSIWMARAMYRRGASAGKPRYPGVVDQEMTNNRQPPDWIGFVITAVFAVAFVILSWTGRGLDSSYLSLSAIASLLVYRFAKEFRTSLKSPLAQLG